MYCDKILSIYKVSQGEFILEKQVTLNIETTTIKLISDNLIQFDEGVISLVSGHISYTKLDKIEQKLVHDREYGVIYCCEDNNLLVKAVNNGSSSKELFKTEAFKNLPIVLQTAFRLNF